jgi:NAD-dependent dihydropyrimidine dehydrogenase PreA subunit
MIRMVSVVVDFDKCTGDGTCIDICPVEVFELQEVDGKTVAVVIAEDQCIVCQACVVQCPEEAITVTE